MNVGGELISIASSAMAAVLVLTGLGKLFSAWDLARISLVSLVFPKDTRIAGRTLGAAELLIGLALFPAQRILHLIALWITLGLFVTASALVYWGLRMDVKPSCGCNGSDAGEVTPKTLLRTIVLAGLSLVCLAFDGLPSSHTVATRLAGCSLGLALVLITPNWSPNFLAHRLSRSQRLVRRLQTKGCRSRKVAFSARLIVRRALRDETILQIHNGLPQPTRITDKWTDGCWHYVSLAGLNAPNRTLVIAIHVFNKLTLRYQLLEDETEKAMVSLK